MAQVCVCVCEKQACLLTFLLCSRVKISISPTVDNKGQQRESVSLALA